MRLKLTGQISCFIADLNKIVELNEEFDCPDNIGNSLLIQGKFIKIKEKKEKKHDNFTSV